VINWVTENEKKPIGITNGKIPNFW